MDDSDIRQNPHPTQAYEITVEVRDAPGAFDAVAGSAIFRVSNQNCSPQDPLSGVRQVPTSFRSTKFEPWGHDRYRATVHLDLLEDDDYFGMGICHWRFDGFVVSLQAHGVSFGSDMLADRIRAQTSDTWFVSKELFHRFDIKDMSVSAVPLSDYIAQHRGEFFSITVTAKERHDGRRME
jgi:hypothetical protein